MRQVYPAWRDEQARSFYPFDDASSLVAFSGQQLSSGLILDAAIHPAGLSGRAFLDSVEKSGTQLIFTVAGNDGYVLCSGSWPMPGAADGAVVALSDENGDPAGLLLVDPNLASDLLVSISETMTFPQDAATFVPTVLSFVSNSSTVDAADGVPLAEAGDVYLIGGDGIYLDCDARTEEIDNELVEVTYVRVNAVGDPLSRRSNCGETKFETPRFIREVVFQKDDKTHRCQPSGLGEVFIVSGSFDGVDTALRVYSESNGISFGLAGRASDTVR